MRLKKIFGQMKIFRFWEIFFFFSIFFFFFLSTCIIKYVTFLTFEIHYNYTKRGIFRWNLRFLGLKNQKMSNSRDKWRLMMLKDFFDQIKIFRFWEIFFFFFDFFFFFFFPLSQKIWNFFNFEIHYKYTKQRKVTNIQSSKTLTTWKTNEYPKLQ